jgi:hypothetical protein
MLVRLDVVASSAQHLKVANVIGEIWMRLARLDVIDDGSLTHFLATHTASLAISSPLSLDLASSFPPFFISIERIIWHWPSPSLLCGR